MIQNDLIEACLKFTPHEGFHQTPLSTLQIVKCSAKTEPTHTVYTPCLCYIVQGEKEALIANKVYRYSPSQYLVSSVDIPVTGQVTEASKSRPYLCLVLEIESDVVYEVISNTSASAPTSAPSQRGFYVEKVNPDLSEAFLRLLRAMQNEDDMKFLAPSIVREIVYRLLSSKYGDVVRQLGIVGSQTQRISKVIETIRRDYASPIKIDELAKMAGMSPSSFHQHFKRVTALSPLQYQKRIRLHEARRLLSLDAGDAASVSFRVGYESPSQFSREYARQFGLPPIADLKRLKSSEP